MADKTLTREQVMMLLAETPRRIAAVSAGRGRAALQAARDGDEWSANDVLAHLRACADVWGGCIAVILAEDTPTVRAVNPRTWIEQTDYREQDFHRSLKAYTAQRAELMGVLEALTPKAWGRTARVKGVGAEVEWSVLFYGQRMAGHERGHVKQMERMLKGG